MRNNTTRVCLSAAALSGNYVNTYGPIFIRGVNTVYFDLTKIAEETNPVLHIVGDFGDGLTYEDTLNSNSSILTMDAVQIATTGKTKSVLQSFIHTYEKTGDSFVNMLTATFILTYASQRIGRHKVCFVHGKDSYYDSIKSVHLLKTQILPVSANDVFALAADENGNAFNLRLSTSPLRK